MRHVPGFDPGWRGYEGKKRERKNPGSSITNVEDDRGGGGEDDRGGEGEDDRGGEGEDDRRRKARMTKGKELSDEACVA